MTDKSIHIQELREKIYNRDNGRCVICGSPGGLYDLTMAHKIERTKYSKVRKFLIKRNPEIDKSELTRGKLEDILNHELNIDLACYGACNDKVLIGASVMKQEELLNSICEDLEI